MRDRDKWEAEETFRSTDPGQGQDGREDGSRRIVNSRTKQSRLEFFTIRCL